MGLNSGMMKMIFSTRSRRLLGVHIVGEGATELIHIGQAVLNLKSTIDYFIENTFNYPITNPGEPIPYGLAGYVYRIESIPQYQGSFSVVEQEISDVCPIGNCLNLSGGLEEWTGMDACVQQVDYDDAGRTTIIFGPAQHLGNADLVERLRVNRGPRWYYLIGGDQMNRSNTSGGQAIGQNVPVAAPSPGTKCAATLCCRKALRICRATLGPIRRDCRGSICGRRGISAAA